MKVLYTLFITLSTVFLSSAEAKNHVSSVRGAAADDAANHEGRKLFNAPHLKQAGTFYYGITDNDAWQQYNDECIFMEVAFTTLMSQTATIYTNLSGDGWHMYLTGTSTIYKRPNQDDFGLGFMQYICMDSKYNSITPQMAKELDWRINFMVVS